MCIEVAIHKGYFSRYSIWIKFSFIAFTYLVIIHHDDVIKWKHFPRYWSFVRGIHRSPVNSPHIGQWRGALMFSLIYVWINGWVNNREAGDLRRLRAHYDVTVMNICTCNNTIAVASYAKYKKISRILRLYQSKTPWVSNLSCDGKMVSEMTH